MFNSSMVGDSSRASSSRRSAFSQTCALLSKYVKENKPFGDLSLAAKFDGRDSNEVEFTKKTTMDLFPVNEKGKGIQKEEISVPNAEFTVDWSETKSAPLTIFYNGELTVFNDFPADKMKEIMELANEYNNKNRVNLSMRQNSFDLNARLNVIQELAMKPLISTVDLPQKRRASLQRFIGKRQERAAASAPYRTSKPEDVQPRNEKNSWLKLAPMGARYL